MRGQQWTEQEDAILRKEWPNKSAKQIARLIGRTDSAIKQKAAAIGLRKYRKAA